MSDPNEIYYVVLRGPGRQPLFKDDDDRTDFTAVVAEAARASGVTVFAYCWLQAEARLAVGISDVSISRFAQRVAKEHARRLERAVSLTGSHFEQKCRGVKVDGQTALADLVRHLHLAPIKAGLAGDPAAYPWSSHRAYLGLSDEPWLAKEPLLKHFGRAEGGAVRGYIQFMSQAAVNLENLRVPTEPTGERSSRPPRDR
jgi:REP element-mobilizing transposase RayT